ncbi:unnamed protein product [Leptidea sinapis]|uniref:Uncharacterized protein n=1 Tax=Leptidea sinapis TaxID=189913 RepID=A0A5E4PKE8_9NEOP|nr:unnamed protein product [Leptidea sinapis]
MLRLGGWKVGIANNPVWIQASSPEHEELAELARQFGIGRYAHPIYSKAGGWPPKVIKLMEEYGRRMGYASSPLPPFSEEEIKLIRVGRFGHPGQVMISASGYSEGHQHQLVWLRRTYGNLSFWITENGSGSIHDIHDEDRIEFIREHLKEVLMWTSNMVYTKWTSMIRIEGGYPEILRVSTLMW